MGKAIAEYSLADLVEDPLVGLVMRSDGVDRRTVELLFERVARVRGGLGNARSPLANKEILRWRSC
jgi:hypothetical protein